MRLYCCSQVDSEILMSIIEQLTVITDSQIYAHVYLFEVEELNTCIHLAIIFSTRAILNISKTRDIYT